MEVIAFSQAPFGNRPVRLSAKRLAFAPSLCYLLDNLPTTIPFSPKEGSMFDLIKKSMLTGLGLALKTKDEVDDLVSELQKQGKMSEAEGRKFLKDVEKRYSQTQERLEKRVDESVREFLKKTKIVTTDELKELKKEIRELKSIVNALTVAKDD
jgi:polyhydroxyalkanoate synthesis regulator phasin